MRELLADIAALSPKVSVREDGTDGRKPSFSVGRPVKRAHPLRRHPDGPRIHLAGAGPVADRRPSAQGRCRGDRADQGPARGSFRFETYISLSCHNCPDVVQALNLMAVLNPGVESVMIDGALYQDEVSARQIMAVPTVMLNGEAFGQGRMTIEEILAKVDTGARPAMLKS
jgi:alkyl hydroperoxide reductase subunit F